jgi:iron complex outermembrane recepter protein
MSFHVVALPLILAAAPASAASDRAIAFNIPAQNMATRRCAA